MRKINTRQLYKLIEAKVREALINGDEYDDSVRREQMDSDWDDLEKINRKYAASKASPVLASKYNHNVEDGREYAEAYVGGFTEESIEHSIMKKINETLIKIANS